MANNKKKKGGGKDEEKDKTKPASKMPENKSSPRSNRTKVTPMQLLRHMSMVIGTIGVILLGVQIQQPIVWTAGTTGSLLGETPVHTTEQAHAFADLSVEEAKDLWAEPESNWKVLYQDAKPLTVECRSVMEGPYGISTVLVARAEGKFQGVSADEMYQFLVSPEGLSFILDPIGNRTNFYQSIETIPNWHGEETTAKTEIAEVTIPSYARLLLFKSRKFIVQSSSIPEEKILVAKSVVHKSRPGSTYFYLGDDAGKNDNKHVRSLATFAFKVVEEDGVVVVKMINYVNMFLLEGIMSYISCKWLFPGVFQRLHERFD